MIEFDTNLDNYENYIEKIVKSQIYSSRKSVTNSCPKCGCSHYIKYGKFKEIQRYRCKECGKTFSLVTNSIWSYSKKKPYKWVKFIEFMLEKKTLEYCADKLKISINTAFYWRHKVLHAMTFTKIPDSLTGKIHMIKISTKENFKGNKHIDTDVREKVFVVSARGKEDSILCLPVCKKRWDINKFNDKVYKRIDPKSIIIPYVDRYVHVIAKKHNEKVKVDKKEIDDRKLRSNCIAGDFDKLISNFYLVCKSWFSPFYGVATKYLKRYFCWLIIYNLKKKFTNMGLFKELILGQFYIKEEDISI